MVKSDDLFVVTVSNKSLAEVLDQRYPVASFQTRNGAHHGTTVGIEDLNLGAVCQIDAARRTIDSNIVKILLAARGCAERNFLEQVVAARRQTCQRERAEHQKRHANRRTAQTRNLH